MKNVLVIGFGIMAAGAALYAAPPPCHLDRGVALAPYAHAEIATMEEWRDSRLAIEKFMDCPPASIDAQSRKTFFDAVASEFTANHGAEIARWRKTYPGKRDSLAAAIGIFQTDMRRFMERIVDRKDAASKDVILRYGDARAVAALGPAVKHDVLAALGNPSAFYGIDHRYHPQLDAIEVLGYWIDPANSEFPPAEKDELTRVLLSLLPHIQSGVNAYEDRSFQSALKALGHSDSIDVETALASWLDRQNDRGGFLYHEATRSLNAVRARRGKA